ncbi:hypothetical protein PVK06_017273 [Gossypium arboreum]|uniref:RNase H type-1 domain-containing protein n=1 Tax=Gossypium arboreum TaxID=29729 RepID=A0ABR0Q2J1_GOSAR|nr:hypothetical protein PVK06_017273 [Gossypium arboreum]
MERDPQIRGFASTSIVTRDNVGRWLGGVERNIDKCSVEQAKLWAIYDGLTLAWDVKWHNIIVETYYAQAITAISEKTRG